MKYIALFLILLIMGCNSKDIYVNKIIPEDKQEIVAKFILDCTKNSISTSCVQKTNNAIVECRKTALEIYGVDCWGYVLSSTNGGMFYPCLQAHDEAQKRALPTMVVYRGK